MKRIRYLVLFFHFLLVEGRIFEKCELRDILRQKLPDVDDWLCLAYHESRFDSSSVGTLNSDGSKDLGLFQISDKYWCTHGSPGKACAVACEALTDNDINDDIECVQKIFSEHQRLRGNGFSAWVAWINKCKDGLGGADSAQWRCNSS